MTKIVPYPSRRVRTSESAVSAFMKAFDDGRFFEAHEILEAFWVELPGRGSRLLQRPDPGRGRVAPSRQAETPSVREASPRGRERILAPYAPRYRSVDVDAILAKLAAA